MKEPAAPGSIVVGIDGSRAATRAALWAVDEALSRDVPLRLLYAIERGDRVASNRAIAETAVGRVRAAIEDTGRPVKIETEIAEGTLSIRRSWRRDQRPLARLGAIRIVRPPGGAGGYLETALGDFGTLSCLDLFVATIRQDLYAAIVVELDGAPDDGALLGTPPWKNRSRATPPRGQ